MERSTDSSSQQMPGAVQQRTAHTTPRLTTAFLALALVTVPGCQSQQPLRAPETLDEVYEQRETLRDSVITLNGRFMGWTGSDCIFPAYAARQATRSDWVFRVGTTCLYVTGGAPPGLSAMEADSMGTPIILEARIRPAADGKLLLEYVRSTPISK